MAVAKKAVPKELLDSLLADYRKPEDPNCPQIHSQDGSLRLSMLMEIQVILDSKREVV